MLAVGTQGEAATLAGERELARSAAGEAQTAGVDLETSD